MGIGTDSIERRIANYEKQFAVSVRTCFLQIFECLIVVPSELGCEGHGGQAIRVIHRHGKFDIAFGIGTGGVRFRNYVLDFVYRIRKAAGVGVQLG